MSTTFSDSVEMETLTPVHWIALLLTILTGIIHVYAGLVEGRIPVSIAGVGFLGAAVLFLLDYYRTILYPVGIVYTAVQFPLWYVVNAGEYTMIGYVDKVIQGMLIVVLAYLFWKQTWASEGDRDATAV